MYILHSAKRRACSCKSIALQMGGDLRYFSRVLGLGVDLVLLIFRSVNKQVQLIWNPLERKLCELRLELTPHAASQLALEAPVRECLGMEERKLSSISRCEGTLDDSSRKFG